MRIEVNVDAGPAQRALAALNARASNLAPMFRGIGADVVAEAQLGFRESRDPYGLPWRPLSYAARVARGYRAAGPAHKADGSRNAGTRRKDGTLTSGALRRFAGAYGSSKPLLDTGRLRNSITYRLLGSTGVEIGSNTAYAAIHQFGGKAGRGRKVGIPARTFIATRERGLPRSYDEIIRDQLARHFRGVAS